MLVTEGALLKKSGGKVPMSQVAKDVSPKRRRSADSQEYWIYDPIAKMFLATAVDRIAGQKAGIIYKLTTKVGEPGKEKPGDTILLPGAARLLIQRHGLETLSLIQSMFTFRNWSTTKVCRVGFKRGQDPQKYWETVGNIEQLERPKDAEEELPIFSITGSAMSRLLVIDNFLVG